MFELFCFIFLFVAVTLSLFFNFILYFRLKKIETLNTINSKLFDFNNLFKGDLL